MTPSPFPPSSRYASVAVTTHTDPDGREVAQLTRRFCPDPDRLVQVSAYTVRQGDRLDRISAHTIGAPEQFWQVADANRALRPEELVQHVGRRLRITLPDGVPGAPDA